MKPADFIVRIPEPCHEDWNSMQPDAKGKFCSSCNKSVFDFSNKTDSEIKNILVEYKDQKVCGRFKKSQVNRPLHISVNLNDLPRNISITKAFGIALFLVFGTLLFSCTDEKGQKVDAIEVIETLPENHTAGMVMPEYPVDSIPTVDSVVEMISEPMIAGGISYDEGFPVPPPPPVVVDPIEYVTLGMVAYSIPGDTTNVVPADSVMSQNARRIGDELPVNRQKLFSVFPNPNSGEFTVKYDVKNRSDVKINIFNMSGALVKSVVNVAAQYEGQYHVPVNLNELSSGIYIVSLINNGTQSTERLVIAR